MSDLNFDPSGDHLLKNVWYAITINPSDKFQYHTSGDKRFKYVYKYLCNNYLNIWKNFGIEFILIPEIKMPDHPKLTRIHYHGKIRFTKKIGLFKWYIHFYDTIGKNYNIKITTITSPSDWDLYCFKNSDLMEPMCKHYKLNYPVTSTNIKRVPDDDDKKYIQYTF